MGTKKKEKKFEWASIPLINYVNVLDDEETEELVHLMKEAESAANAEGQVEFHKERLGKQIACFQVNFRWWVWEGKNWRVFASNKAKRISIEVRAGLGKKLAWQAFDSYRRQVGLLR
jgi:hypothetical protein